MKKFSNLLMFFCIVAILSACIKSMGTGYKQESDSNQVMQMDLGSMDIQRIVIPKIRDYCNISTIAEGYVYYLGDKGAIYQAPIDNVNDAKVVFKLPSGNMYSDDGYAVPWLTTINGMAVLKYHLGSASMGAYYSVKLFPDGSYEESDRSFSNIVQIDNVFVALESGYPNHAFNIKHKGEKEFSPYGNPGYIYGMYVIEDKSGGTSFKPNSDLAAVGNDVYVIAQKCEEISDTPNGVGLYRINIKTNEMKRIFPDHQVKHFKIYDGYIYFTDFSGLLYKAEIGKDSVVKVSDVAINIFYVLGENIYYTPFASIYQSGNNQELFRLGDDTPIVSRCVLETPEMNANINEGFLCCRLFDLDSDILQHRGIVIGESGESVVLEDPNIEYITVYDGVIYEVLSEK